jgi:hypothetical protein
LPEVAVLVELLQEMPEDLVDQVEVAEARGQALLRVVVLLNQVNLEIQELSEVVMQEQDLLQDLVI